MGADEYPYDPALDVRRLHGLDKLRALPDRRMAEQLYRIWIATSRLDDDPRWKARLDRERRQKAREELRQLERFVERALDGDFGTAVQTFADRFWAPHVERSLEQLSRFRAQARQIPGARFI